MEIKRFYFCVTCLADAEDGGLHIVRLHPESGGLERVFRFGEGPVFYGCYDPARKRIYSIRAERFNEPDGKDELLSWNYDAATPRAMLLHRRLTNQIGSCYVHTDASEGLLLLAHYNSASLSGYMIDAGIDSVPERLDWHPQLSGSGSYRERQEQPHPHCIVGARLEDPAFRMGIYAADLGSDRIWHFQFDLSTREIHASDPASFPLPPGSGPRHLCLHPEGETLYCLNELSNTLSTFRRDVRTGILHPAHEVATLPESFAGESFAGDLAVAADGRHLYATNRGHDSIVCFDLPEPTRPELAQSIPAAAPGPQNLCLSSDGGWLLCAHLAGGRLSALPVDQLTGRIAPASEHIEMPGAACVFELV